MSLYLLLSQQLSLVLLSQFEFLSCHNLSLVTFWVFKFCYILFFWVLSQFEFWFCHNEFFFFKFCHSFIFFLVLSILEFLSFVTIWVFELSQFEFFLCLSQFEFFSFITSWIFELSQFLYTFVTIWVFECFHLDTSTTDQLSGQLFAILAIFWCTKLLGHNCRYCRYCHYRHF